jgi:hypothetical protein
VVRDNPPASAISSTDKACEVVQLEDRRLPLRLRLEAPQRLVQLEEARRVIGGEVHGVIERHRPRAAATLLRLPVACVVQQHSPHRPRRHGHEMGAAPRGALDVHEPQVDLMHQPGGTQRMPGSSAFRRWWASRRSSA